MATRRIRLMLYPDSLVRWHAKIKWLISPRGESNMATTTRPKKREKQWTISMSLCGTAKMARRPWFAYKWGLPPNVSRLPASSIQHLFAIHTVMAETNQHPAQAEPNGAQFVPDETNSGQNATYQYWPGDPAAIASSSNRDRGKASTNPYFT